MVLPYIQCSNNATESGFKFVSKIGNQNSFFSFLIYFNELYYVSISRFEVMLNHILLLFLLCFFHLLNSNKIFNISCHLKRSIIVTQKIKTVKSQTDKDLYDILDLL